MNAVSQASSSVTSDPVPSKPLHEQVALRAFSKWLARGCPDGDGGTDWYEALKELQQEPARQQASFVRWPVPTLPQPTAWWAVYGKLHELDGMPERLF